MGTHPSDEQLTAPAPPLDAAATRCAFDAAGDALGRASGGRIRGRAAWALAITLLAAGVSLAVGLAGWFLV